MKQNKGKHSHTGDWQSRFVADLQAATNDHPEVVSAVKPGPTIGGRRSTHLTLNTNGIVHAPGGMRLQPYEDVILLHSDSPARPPNVYVNHERFSGYPHVLTAGPADELCIYLDVAREWDPEQSALGFLHRLYQWLADAADARFDAETALFHPVGGRAHTSTSAPIIVAREELAFTKRLGIAYLQRRSETRLDLFGVDPGKPAEAALAVRFNRPLTRGPGDSVGELADRVRADGGPDLLAALGSRVKRLLDKTDSTWCHLVVGVPRPSGGFYLMVGRCPLPESNQHLTLPQQPMEWCTVSDERPSVSTRRDQRRPVSALQDKNIAVVGCGGLGSWIAEFVARAGPASIGLTDFARVGGALLVRQNFIDGDIGSSKAQALAQRLHSINPDAQLIVNDSSIPSEWTQELLGDNRGILIDATVSRAMVRMLESLRPGQSRECIHAQVLTDVATASLGLVLVSGPHEAMQPSQLDLLAGEAVQRDSRLEPYSVFWEDSAADELFPNPGCSYPTFHGSAADLAAVAAEMVNLVALHVGSGQSGVHLFALPHSGVVPSHVFLNSNLLRSSQP